MDEKDKYQCLRCQCLSSLITNLIVTRAFFDNLTVPHLRCYQALPLNTSGKHVSRIFHRSPEIEVPCLG